MTDDSHGLRYELTAIIARRSLLGPLCRTQPDAGVVRLPVAGLGLLPATDTIINGIGPAALRRFDPDREVSADTGKSWVLTGPESGFRSLTPALLSLLGLVSRRGPVAYLEADYLGRDGAQSAALWRHGRLSVGPLLLGRYEPFPGRHAPISVVLRELGVCAAGRRDEFVVAGLGRHRSTAGWARAIHHPPGGLA